MSRVARLAFLAFALVLALIVSFLSYRMMSKQSITTEKTSKVKAQQIAVAAIDIQRGHKLTQEDIRYAGYLADTCPAGAFSSEQAPVDRVAMTTIKASVPILESQLASKDITQGVLIS